MSQAIRRPEAEEEQSETHNTDRFTEIVAVLDSVRQATAGARHMPSSIMLQVLLYGDTFKRVITSVDVNVEEFERKYTGLLTNLSRSLGIVEPYTKHTYYDRFWAEPKLCDPVKVQNIVNKALEPLNGVCKADFGLKTTPKFNWKFSEAFETYVFQERIEGVSFFNGATRSLTVFFKVRGAQPRMSASDVMVDYYALIRLESTPDGRVNVVYGCTCPHARGETKDSRGKPIPPEVTGMCKHVIAGLFYFFPNIFAFISAAKKGKLNNSTYSEELRSISELYESFKNNIDNVIKNLKNDLSKPPNEETESRVIMSNVVYLLYREFWNSLQSEESKDPLLRNVRKLVPPVSMLHEFESLWKALSPRIVDIKEEAVQTAGGKPTSEVLSQAIARMEKLGLYERLNTVRELLNGLQGSVEDTPYTRSILSSLILGSNPLTDPIIVSSCGDPGTGKTLTAVGVGELVGFSSLVVEREISAEDIIGEAKNMVAKRVERYVDFFEKVVLPKVPKEKAEEASEFFRRSIEDITTAVTTDEVRDLSKVARGLAETFSALYGVESKRAVVALSKLYLSLMKLARRVYLEYSTGRALERKVVEERRRMLQKLQEVGLISSAEEKEKFNSGSVRWDVQQTATGYRVLVYVDLHYLLARYKSDKAKIEKVVEELSKLGEVRFVKQKGGVAEVKLSEASYLEKSLRTREEDVGGKLIWVGGELTRMGIILIDESRRAPELLERMLTDLSKAAKDTKRTNIIITTDNAEPLMEAENDPRLDAFHSRINFEVTTPSSTVEATIESSLRRINELDISGKLPLVTFDELYALSMLAEHVEVPERYMQIAYSIPLLMAYDFKILRPEIVAAPGKGTSFPPLILVVPKGGFEASNVRGDYEACSWGVDVSTIRRMPERRFGHHVMRAMKALAIVDKKTVVDEDVFISAIATVLPSRVVPVDVQDPYRYFDHKQRYVDAIINKIREILRRKQTATEKLIEVVGSMSPVPHQLLQDALEEMIANPVLTSMFCRFLEQMLVSKKSKEFVEYAKTVPGLIGTLDLLSRYEKLPTRV